MFFGAVDSKVAGSSGNAATDTSAARIPGFWGDLVGENPSLNGYIVIITPKKSGKVMYHNL